MRRFFNKLVDTVFPGRRELDLAQELESHLGLLEADFARAGLKAPAARRAATRTFGGVEQAKERHRDERSFTWLGDAGRDLRHGVRILRRDPLFTFTAAASLAIAISANTTIVTLADSVFLRPPVGVVGRDRLVDIGSDRGRGAFGPMSYPNYVDVRDRTTTFRTAYAYSQAPQAMRLAKADASGPPESVRGSLVTANYFTALGVVPAWGRLFDARDSDQPGTSPIAVLSYAFWTRHFSQNPDVIGGSLTLNGVPLTIVGIAPNGFRGTGIRASDVWVPMAMATAMNPQGMAAFVNRGSAWLLMGGRLKPGVSLKKAAAELGVIARALEAEHTQDNQRFGLRVLASSAIPGNNAPIIAFLALLMLIVSLVLAVACANVAGVLLARGLARRQEIAVRLTMGAGRGRLLRQLLTETLLLFCVGGACGLLLARGAMAIASSYLAASPLALDVPLALDGRVVVFAIALTLGAALFSGLTPAWQGSKGDVASALKGDAQAPDRLRLRHLFLAAQVALSIFLVVIAGICIRALQQAGSVDPGFEPHGVELASVNLSQAGYTPDSGIRFARELVTRLRPLPRVKDATLAAVVPGGFETRRESLTVPGFTPPNGQRFFNADWNVVAPDYFSTLRISLYAGRDFREDDVMNAPLVAIVSEAAAEQFWPGQRAQVAIGKRLVQPVFGPAGLTNETLTWNVVGVAHDVRSTTVVDGVSLATVYVPFQQAYTPTFTIAARSTDGQRLTRELQSLLASMNPNLPITAAQTLEESVAFGLMPQRVVGTFAGGLGLVGMLLAGLGIYGVTAYVVARRTREIGIRMALGAARVSVIRMILVQGMWPVMLGAVAGLMLAIVGALVLTAYLVGVSPVDPVTLSGVAGLFLLIALAACYVPVRRATQINAMEALRYN